MIVSHSSSGASAIKVLDALKKHDGDSEKAVDTLLSSIAPTEDTDRSVDAALSATPPPVPPRKNLASEDADAQIAKELQDAFDTAEAQKAKLQRYDPNTTR